MALIDKASLLMVPSVYEDGTLYNVLPSGNKAPDETGNHNGYDQTRADFTFSRGSNLAATRVNANGLIEKGRENLFTQSNNLTHSDWEDGSNTSISSGFVDKDGGTNAFRLTMTSGIGTYFYQTKSLTNGGVYTLSFWAKANGSTHLYTSGDTGYESVPLTNEWQRFEFYFVLSTSTPSIGLDNNAEAVDCLIMNMQLEAGLVSTPYIETGATTATAGVLENTPRIDYSSGAGALLLESQRTNLITNSEALSIGTSGSSVEQNTSETTSPEGVYNATKVLGTTNYLAKGVGSAFSGNNTTSVFLKKGNDSTIGVYMYDGAYYRATFNLETGTIDAEVNATATIEDYGNGWYRCSIYKQTPANVVEIGIDGVVGYCYTYGWQHEYNASYPSSYVPTYGSAATRGADSCSVTGASDVIGQTEGTIYVDLADYDGNTHLVTLGDGTASNYIMLYISSGAIAWLSSGGFSGSAGSISAGDKAALAYKENDSVLYLNGVQMLSDTSNTIPNIPNIYLNDNATLSNKLHLQTKQVVLFNERLTNEELATLTTL